MADMTKKGLSYALSGLTPAWFSVVMATGIVDIAAHTQGIPITPIFLMWANILFYTLLWVVYLARLVIFPRAFFSDFRQHMRAMGYFTIVAGSGVLGLQILQVGNYQAGAHVSVVCYPLTLDRARVRHPHCAHRPTRGETSTLAGNSSELALMDRRYSERLGPRYAGRALLRGRKPDRVLELFDLAP